MSFKKSISNIAWNFEDNKKIFKILKDENFDFIEIAPIEIIDDWNNFNLKKMNYFKSLIKDFNLSVCSIQGIFYKTNFTIEKEPKQALAHFEKIKKICDFFNCNYLVFGAPRTRKFVFIQTEEKRNLYMKKFLTPLTQDFNIGIEAIPKKYDTNFCNTYDEVLEFIKDQKLKLHFDTQCAGYENIDRYASKINKNLFTTIHLSKNSLECLSGQEVELKKLLKSNFCDDKYVSIEMKKSSVEEIKKSINIFKEIK